MSITIDLITPEDRFFTDLALYLPMCLVQSSPEESLQSDKYPHLVPFSEQLVHNLFKYE